MAAPIPSGRRIPHLVQQVFDLQSVFGKRVKGGKSIELRDKLFNALGSAVLGLPKPTGCV